MATEKATARFKKLETKASQDGGMFSGAISRVQWNRVYKLREYAEQGLFTGEPASLTNTGLVDAGIEALEIQAKDILDEKKEAEKAEKAKASKPAKKPAKKTTKK